MTARTRGQPVATPEAPARLSFPARDCTARLLQHGYRFSERLRSSHPESDPDAIPLRLAGAPALLLRGPQGVRLFSDTAVVSREDATPRLVAGPLFGHGAVHGLDGASHVHRKGLFVDVTRSPRPMELVGLAGAEWQSARERWRPGAGLVVEHEAVRVFGRAVFRWAGIDLPEAQVDRLAQRLATIVDGFAVPGPAYARAVLARRQTDAWAARLVEDVRDGTVEAAPGKALAIAAGWTDDAGELLPAKVAAVELQNVLRPTIAVSRFAAFAVLALAQHGDWRRRLASEEAAAAAQVGSDRRRVPSRDSSAWAFAHEVRRLTPFVPLLAGLTDVEVEHRGVRVPAGTRLLLDVVGTNRDPRFWDRPLDFDPGRFLDDREWERDALVPQGGGLVAAGHRCPGEDTTLGLIATTSAFFAGLSWTVPAQDLGVSSRRMPTRPASGTRVVLT